MHKKIASPDLKAAFIKTKVGNFIKSYDKALPGKHKYIFYNRQTKNNRKSYTCYAKKYLD